MCEEEEEGRVRGDVAVESETVEKLILYTSLFWQ